MYRGKTVVCFPCTEQTAWKKRIEKKIKERERRDVETDIRHQHRCDTIDSTQVFVEFRVSWGRDPVSQYC